MTRPMTFLRRTPRGSGRSRRRVLAGPATLVAIAVAAFAVLSLTGGRSASGATAPVSNDPAVINAGLQLYEVHCQSCHGANGVGGTNGSPELIDAGAAAADWYITTGRMPLNNPADEAIRRHPFFDAQQTEELVAYVNALPAINAKPNMTGPGIPLVAPACVQGTTDQPAGCTTLTMGEQLFSLNCAQCHHEAGSGGMLSKANVIPSLRNATARQVAEAIRIGPKPMPIFGAGELSDEQVSAIANYVQYLHNPEDRGGLGIGHFGPVPEGFVGIILGFGLILLISRLMGNRG
ncbi:MAG TPA: c-type cytochrome [Acidimicrobiales bacterium]|nr:c-type cytochrome [Acidimicrobiales bacterium]